MLRIIILSSIRIAVALPVGVAAIFGLIQAAKANKFDQADPEHLGQMTVLANAVLGLSVEHWIGWLILSVFLGTFWAILVAEPREASKKKFATEAKRRLNGKR